MGGFWMDSGWILGEIQVFLAALLEVVLSSSPSDEHPEGHLQMSIRRGTSR